MARHGRGPFNLFSEPPRRHGAKICCCLEIENHPSHVGDKTCGYIDQDGGCRRFRAPLICAATRRDAIVSLNPGFSSCPCSSPGLSPVGYGKSRRYLPKRQGSRKPLGRTLQACYCLVRLHWEGLTCMKTDKNTVQEQGTRIRSGPEILPRLIRSLTVSTPLGHRSRIQQLESSSIQRFVRGQRPLTRTATCALHPFQGTLQGGT